MPSKPSITRTCERCGVEFLIRSVDARRGKGRFCSRSCASAAVSKQHLSFGKTGAANQAWKGGLTKSPKGYWYILNPSHPRAMTNGYVKRATIVLEEKIGRRLRDGEFAHHDNEDKEDDSPNNLILMTMPKHNRIHHPKKPRKLKPDSPYNRRYQWPDNKTLLKMRSTMSLREIAGIIGCSHKAVDRRLKTIPISLNGRASVS